MDWYVYLLIAVVLLLVVYGCYILFQQASYNKAVADISEIFNKVENTNEIAVNKSTDIFQLEVNGTKRYLVKILIVNPQNEVIITNSEKVIINSDISGWKRSSQPNFVSGIKEFINLGKNEQDFYKVVVIYPDCHGITKYLNESDCELVEKEKPVDSLYFVKYKELKEFLANQ